MTPLPVPQTPAPQRVVQQPSYGFYDTATNQRLVVPSSVIGAGYDPDLAYPNKDVVTGKITGLSVQPYYGGSLAEVNPYDTGKLKTISLSQIEAEGGGVVGVPRVSSRSQSILTQSGETTRVSEVPNQFTPLPTTPRSELLPSPESRLSNYGLSPKNQLLLLQQEAITKQIKQDEELKKSPFGVLVPAAELFGLKSSVPKMKENYRRLQAKSEFDVSQDIKANEAYTRKGALGYSKSDVFVVGALAAPVLLGAVPFKLGSTGSLSRISGQTRLTQTSGVVEPPIKTDAGVYLKIRTVTTPKEGAPIVSDSEALIPKNSNAYVQLKGINAEPARVTAITTPASEGVGGSSVSFGGESARALEATQRPLSVRLASRISDFFKNTNAIGLNLPENAATRNGIIDAIQGVGRNVEVAKRGTLLRFGSGKITGSLTELETGGAQYSSTGVTAPSSRPVTSNGFLKQSYTSEQAVFARGSVTGSAKIASTGEIIIPERYVPTIQEALSAQEGSASAASGRFYASQNEGVGYRASLSNAQVDEVFSAVSQASAQGRSAGALQFLQENARSSAGGSFRPFGGMANTQNAVIRQTPVNDFTQTTYTRFTPATSAISTPNGGFVRVRPASDKIGGGFANAFNVPPSFETGTRTSGRFAAGNALRNNAFSKLDSGFVKTPAFDVPNVNKGGNDFAPKPGTGLREVNDFPYRNTPDNVFNFNTGTPFVPVFDVPRPPRVTTSFLGGAPSPQQSGGFGAGLLSMFSGKGRKGKYTPSLLGIFSGKSVRKAPSILTGGEVRFPIYKKRR